MLDLSSLKIKEIPKEITKLKEIKRLELEGMLNKKINNKKTFQNLSKMKSLQELNIQGNFFMTIDENISLLKHLKKIELDGNCLNDDEYKKIVSLLPYVEIQNKINC